jgi:hypothetical protein
MEMLFWLTVYIQSPYWPLSGRASSTDFEARLWAKISVLCQQECSWRGVDMLLGDHGTPKQKCMVPAVCEVSD